LAPADFLCPRIHFYLPSFPVGRRFFDAVRGVLALLADGFGERLQIDGSPALIDCGNAFDRTRRHVAVTIPIELRAVELRFPFHDTDAIFQIGRLPYRNLPRCCRLTEKLEALAL